jgi:protein-S-isoprenylcysteine O-methyltransferase Ste14
MTLDQRYTLLLTASFVLAIATLVSAFFFRAPYGRWLSRKWGPVLPGWLGWVLMETPAALTIAIIYFSAPLPAPPPGVAGSGGSWSGLTSLVFLLMWEAHYVHRAFIYPFTRSDPQRPMPLAVPALGIAFNLLNGWLNGTWLFLLSGGYPRSWLRDSRFLLGLVIFLAGFVINRAADRTLRQLRAPGELDYKIPRGGLYRWVSCPNYLGEIILWTGWAIATWSLPGLSFAVWTFANLAPRAIGYHRWYRQRFTDYPPERRALIPFVW